MTVAASIPIQRYDGNDSATEFSFPHIFYNDADLVVILREPGEIDTILTLDVDYSVTGKGTDTGHVDYPLAGDPLATGESITIFRSSSKSRTADILQAYFFGILNLDMDKIVMMIQEISEQLGRAALYTAPNPDTPPSLEAVLASTGDGQHASLEGKAFAVAGHTDFTGFENITGVPSSAPSEEGQIKVSTNLDLAYISTGKASSADWQLAVGYGGTKGIISVTFDGGGSELTTGVKKPWVYVPYNGNITSAVLLADQSGSIVIDVWRTNYTDFDAGSTHPVNGDSVTGATPPTISAATKSKDVALSDWEFEGAPIVQTDDVIGFNIDSISTITKCVLILTIDKTGV